MLLSARPVTRSGLRGLALISSMTALAIAVPVSAQAVTSPPPSTQQRIASSLGTQASGLTVEGKPGKITRVVSAAGHTFARPKGVTAHSSPGSAASTFVASHRSLLGTPRSAQRAPSRLRSGAWSRCSRRYGACRSSVARSRCR